VRRGLYEGNTRKEWLTITEEEQAEYKQKLSNALNESNDVNKKLDKSLKEFADIQKTE
jgi:hypothetical protein